MPVVDKLRSILLVVPDAHHRTALFEKAALLASSFDARVELMESTSDGDVLERLTRQAADLVIKAPASQHPLRRWTFDDTDRRLAALSPVPLLLARSRPWAHPPRFAAAMDVADRDTESQARGILQAAGFLSLGTSACLDVFYSEREQRDDRLRMERAVRAAALVREFRVGGEHLRLLEGAPDRTLPPLLARRHFDLLVLGGATRRAGVGALLPSLSETLADAATSDLLLVNPTLPTTRLAPIRRESMPSPARAARAN